LRNEFKKIENWLCARRSPALWVAISDAAAVVAEEEPKMSISNFKLGDRPVGEHPRRGDDEEADENPVPVKGCVQKQILNIKCPDPHVKFYLYAGYGN